MGERGAGAYFYKRKGEAGKGYFPEFSLAGLLGVVGASFPSIPPPLLGYVKQASPVGE